MSQFEESYTGLARAGKRDAARRRARHGMRVQGTSVKVLQAVMTRKAEAARAGAELRRR